MTTAVAPDYAVQDVGGRYHFLLRRLHSLTGILFGGYIVVHLLVNATLIEGTRHGQQATIFQQQVDSIHRLPFLLAVEWTFIYLPILFHTVYGVWIVLTGQPNAGRYGYAKNWAYVAQRVSAVVLVFFIAFHVLGMKGAFGGDVGRALTFNATQATQSTVNHFRASALVGYVVYPVGILAATYHLANGFWTAAISWGLTISAKSQRRWGFACAGIFLLTTACGFTALASALAGTPGPADQSDYRSPGKIGGGDAKADPAPPAATPGAN